MPTASICITPAAREALKQVVAEHGPIMFHISGGRVGGRQFPICLPAGSLRIGARDHLLGDVDGMPIFEMEDRENMRAVSGEYVLDVVEGYAIGFSLPAGPGKRFFLQQVAGAQCAVAG